jgi:hypothetical protein
MGKEFAADTLSDSRRVEIDRHTSAAHSAPRLPYWAQLLKSRGSPLPIRLPRSSARTVSLPTVRAPALRAEGSTGYRENHLGECRGTRFARIACVQPQWRQRRLLLLILCGNRRAAAARQSRFESTNDRRRSAHRHSRNGRTQVFSGPRMGAGRCGLEVSALGNEVDRASDRGALNRFLTASALAL